MIYAFSFSLPAFTGCCADRYQTGRLRRCVFFFFIGCIAGRCSCACFFLFPFFFLSCCGFFLSCFLSMGIYAPSPAPTLTLSHMLIWHFLLKGHGWIMFCRRGSSCYMKNDAAGVFSRFYVAIWTTKLHSLQAVIFLEVAAILFCN